MSTRPCAALATSRAIRRAPLPALAAAVALAAMLLSAAAALAAGPMSSVSARHVLVRVVGQGATPQAAKDDAVRTAQVMAARYYSGLGGASALDDAPDAQRIVNAVNMPGSGPTRLAALVELRLRPLQEPPPATLGLPEVYVVVDKQPGKALALTVKAYKSIDILALTTGLDPSEPPLALPGGNGAVYAVTPSKPARLELILARGSAHVVGCTGGLDLPRSLNDLDDALAHARAGKPQPGMTQGVSSECVTVQALLPLTGDIPKRSMRQKGSEAPVNMTGAAGRDAGLPVGKDLP